MVERFKKVLKIWSDELFINLDQGRWARPPLFVG